MNAGVVIFSVLFAFAAYREAIRFGKRYGPRTVGLAPCGLGRGLLLELGDRHHLARDRRAGRPQSRGASANGEHAGLRTHARIRRAAVR